MDLARPILLKHRGYTGARLELMKKAASLSLEGATIPEISKELTVSESTVRRLLKASEGLPTSYLSETAQVARLLDLHRLNGLLTVAFPVALGRVGAIDQQSDARDKTRLRERWEAMRIVLDVIKERAKLLRYEGVPAQD